MKKFFQSFKNNKITWIAIIVTTVIVSIAIVLTVRETKYEESNQIEYYEGNN